ncbi:MAG: Gfo/Idh/MocA family oxidoreductase [Actinomycetia bacterium]|nr:Gfo/Idh/MocA family oxidoreductase [Actinomycetes bacterium]
MAGIIKKGSQKQTKIKYGMIGGGPDAFFGAVHRAAAALDGKMELAAGAFSSSAEKSNAQGRELMLDPARVYGSYQEMAEKEAGLPEEERIDFVSIVTPNHVHYPAAKLFMEAGFNIICDKPMTRTIEEAEDLCRIAKEKDKIFAVTYTYTGYPMVKQARKLIKDGKIGEIRKVVVLYPQGWLTNTIEKDGAKQAVWRTDPAQAGISSCMGDLGTHIENMSNYITGLEMEEILADLTIFGKDRVLDDDGNVLVHYENGARGILYASQISVGEENNLRFMVYGTEASLEWHQENPNYLYLRSLDGPEQVYRRGNDYLEDITGHNSRLPFGHPEAFIESLANIYLNTSRTMLAKKKGEEPGGFDTDFPTVRDGAKGVHFVHKTVESSKSKKWVNVRYDPICQEPEPNSRTGSWSV